MPTNRATAWTAFGTAKARHAPYSLGRDAQATRSAPSLLPANPYTLPLRAPLTPPDNRCRPAPAALDATGTFRLCGDGGLRMVIVASSLTYSTLAIPF